MLQADESSDGNTIDLKIGETLELRLPENRTTGFKWALESSDEGGWSLVSDDFEAGSQPGQPGSQRWSFRGERAGSESIKLSYRRGWEEKGTAERTFTLRIRVQA